jgi:hypothetical protein
VVGHTLAKIGHSPGAAYLAVLRRVTPQIMDTQQAPRTWSTWVRQTTSQTAQPQNEGAWLANRSLRQLLHPNAIGQQSGRHVSER